MLDSRYQEWFEELKHLLPTSRYSHYDGWFFPSDLIPHSASFKYRCAVLFKEGLLERSPQCGRWGWRYRIKEVSDVG